MSEILKVYGFGSFFLGVKGYRDIDILLVHGGADFSSCEFAIACKRWLASRSSEFDVTMLSAREEREFSFVSKSKAIFIGSIDSLAMEEGLRLVEKKISLMGDG